MNKRNKILGTSLTASAILATVVVSQSDFKPHSAFAEGQLEEETITEEQIETVNPKEVDPDSIQLSPGMYVPEATELRNQKVDKADVIQTLNLEEIRLSKQAGLAELMAGIEVHLGRGEDTLSYDRINLYNQYVIEYAGRVQEMSENAQEAAEVEAVMDEFRNWVSTYAQAITDEIAEQNRQKEVKEEVVEETNLPSNVTLTDRISYAIPDLGDEYLTYMPYTAITAKNTPHYRLQQLATTNEEGYRVYEGAIGIALASSYGTQIGTIYEIVFEDGKVMKGILSDNKADQHTDEKKQYRDASERYDGKSGNIVEIVFDTTNYDGMNAVNRKINSDYPAHVKSITKIGVAKGFEK